MKSNQIKIGIKVESEHKGTYNFLNKYIKTHRGKLPPKKIFYKSITADHLRESKTYYTKLKKAKL